MDCIIYKVTVMVGVILWYIFPSVCNTQVICQWINFKFCLCIPFIFLGIPEFMIEIQPQNAELVIKPASLIYFQFI